MCIFIMSALIGIFMVNTVQANRDGEFLYVPEKDHYGQALLQVARGEKDAAVRTLECIDNDGESDGLYAWQKDQPDDIDAFFDKLLIDYIKERPQTLSDLGLFESIGFYEHNAYLDDISFDTELRKYYLAKMNLETLNNYAVETLSEDQKISHTIFLWMLTHFVSGEKFILHEYKINQLHGVLIDLNFLLTSVHTIKTERDVHHYIARLNAIPQQFEQIIEFMELQKKHGIVPPRFTVEKVINMITNMVPDSVTENIFYLHVQKHMHVFDARNSDEIMHNVHQVIHTVVHPAYVRLKNYFIQLLAVAQSNNGVWALPDGDAYYAHMLQYHTTTTLSADEIHQLGIEQVAKISDEMRALLAAEGIVDATKTVGQLMQQVAQDEQFFYPNTDEGRAQCLQGYEHILARSRAELAHLFAIRPKNGVEIKPVPVHQQEGAPGAYYYGPSFDGSRQGMFFANLRNMNEVPKYGMETLTIHEAEPGHHFQIALQYEMKMPFLRNMMSYNAYCEGWALYTEKLAYEHNFYSSSFSKLGHLSDELLRAARLVIDTGIHHKRWSREHAIEYMQQVTGYHYDSVVGEVERYFVLPGQACSYKIGQLKILELRKKAQDALADKFDIREFHTQVLQVGQVPLMVLQEVIEAYIERKLNDRMRVKDIFKLPAYVGIILVQDNQVLFVKRHNTDWATGCWNFPGGLLEENETLINAAAREALEETGVTIDPSDLQLVHVIQVRANESNTKDILGFYFKAEKWQGTPINNEPHRHSDIGWFSFDDVNNTSRLPITAHAMQALHGLKNGVVYSEN